MFQTKIDRLFSDIPNVFGLAGDILIVGFDADGRDYDGEFTASVAKMQTG